MASFVVLMPTLKDAFIFASTWTKLSILEFHELIFESIDTPGLIQCVLVSETWKVLAENVLIKRWKGKMFEDAKMEKQKLCNYFWNAAILKKVY